jgi:hypothetical protein
MQASMRQSLEIATEKWIEMDKGVKITETITDEQIMDSVINPEK